MIVTEREHGGRVTVSAGTVITVRLQEQPTTGYRWAVERAEGLQAAGDRTEAGAGVGGAGMRELQFRATQPGTHELRLKKWREWEGDASVTERFAVTVVVA